MNLINKNIVNIQKIIRILVFFMGFNAVIPVVNGSILFWFNVFISILFGLYIFLEKPKDFILDNKYEILFIIACIVSSLINYSYMNIYSYVKTLIMCLMFFILMSHTKKQTKETLKSEMDIIFWAIILFAFFVTGASLIKTIVTDPKSLIDSILGARYLGYYENANQSAYWAFFSLILGLIYFNKNKVFFTINSIIQMIMIVISGSRAIYIGLFISIVIYFLYYSLIIKKISKKKVIITLIGLSLIIFVLLIVLTLLRFKWVVKYLQYLDFEALMDLLTSYRYFMWKDAFMIFLNSPLIGVGVSNIYEAAVKYLGMESTIVKLTIEDPHNIFLSLLAYTGIFGFTSFTLIITSKIKAVFNVVKKGINERTIPLMILFVSIFVFSIFDVAVVFDSHIATMLFWYVCGIFNAEYNLSD